MGVVRAWAAYRPPLTHALLELKYRPNRALAEILAAGMAESYRRCRWNASLVVPVPLAPARRRRRGFNQAGLLATALSQQLGIQLHVGALRRIRETRSQVGLGPKERRENVSGAFWANPELVSGERPLVVDDLTTTGSTLGACSQALFEAGALEVYGLAAAKAR